MERYDETHEAGAQTRTRQRSVATRRSTRKRSPGASIPSSLVISTIGFEIAAVLPSIFSSAKRQMPGRNRNESGRTSGFTRLWTRDWTPEQGNNAQNIIRARPGLASNVSKRTPTWQCNGQGTNHVGRQRSTANASIDVYFWSVKERKRLRQQDIDLGQNSINSMKFKNYFLKSTRCE